MCKRKLLTPWLGHEEICNGYSHTYRDQDDRPITPAMLGENLGGTFRAMCPDAPWPEEVEPEIPSWELTAEREARERREAVDAFFIRNPEQTFDTFDPEFNDQHDAVRDCRLFLRDERIRHLILKGDVGRGKSHLAQACIQAVSIPAAMISAAKLYWLRRAIESIDDRDETSLAAWDRIQASRILAVDDLGSEKQTDALVFTQTFKELLDVHPGRLIVTTNLGEKEMTELYGQKIVSRLHEDALQIILEGRDFRTR